MSSTTLTYERIDGDKLRLTALVDPPVTPARADSMSFTLNGQVVGRARVNEGVATLTLPVPEDGDHVLGAYHDGGDVIAASNSDPLLLTQPEPAPKPAPQPVPPQPAPKPAVAPVRPAASNGGTPAATPAAPASSSG